MSSQLNKARIETLPSFLTGPLLTLVEDTVTVEAAGAVVELFLLARSLSKLFLGFESAIYKRRFRAIQTNYKLLLGINYAKFGNWSEKCRYRKIGSGKAIGVFSRSQRRLSLNFNSQKVIIIRVERSTYGI